MVGSVTQSSIREQRPVSRFGPLDDLPRRIARLEDMDPSALGRHIGLEADTAAALLERARLSQSLSFAAATTSSVPQESLERALRTLIHPADERLAITDVVPAHGPVMSGRPFALRVHFAAAALNPPRLASVRVEWSGEPFVHEALLTAEDAASGYVDVVFGADQTLPAGAATFAVSLYNALGAMSRFTTTCAVLPSNPFALQVGPNGSFVTGTWSARGVRNGDAYDTGIAVTLFNGGTPAVSVQPGFHWTFWDGGVGGSLVEQGDGAFAGGTITVPAEGTWGGWISFHSPDGSGIFKHYQDREDMTIEIAMTRTDGGTVRGTITARTMFAFGINITGVAGEDFTGQEWSDLDAAAERTRTIYERRDLTFSTDDRFIPHAQVGGYEIIDSFDEFHHLLADWSGPNTNTNIDAFIVQAINVGGGVDGIDGSIPGPTSHDGSDSGVIASKSGFVDASGARRLHSDYLGMLIGHEIGHYLGLVHVSDAGNLMLPSSGTNDINLSYDQYRTMIRHGWVRID